MKHLPCLVALALAVLMCVPAAHAQDAENATTPADLNKLLPKGGLGEGIDFYLLMESEAQEGSMFMRWTIRPDGDRIVCAVVAGGGDGQFSYKSTSKLVYSKAGHLLSYHSVDDFGGNASITTGEVKDGKLIITSVAELGEDFPDDVELSEPNITEVDLKDLEGMLPMQWLPLVFGYHIREGNLGYTIKMFDNLEYANTNTMTVEDNGTEKVEFNGAEQEVHSLQVTSKTEFETDPDFAAPEIEEQKLRVRVLKDGTIFSMDMTEGEFEMKARRATAAEFEEAMKKHKKVAPGEVEDAAVEDAVEEAAE